VRRNAENTKTSAAPRPGRRPPLCYVSLVSSAATAVLARGDMRISCCNAHLLALLERVLLLLFRWKGARHSQRQT
jgi:hypothetical protein